MSFEVRSASIGEDTLMVVIVDGFRELETTFTGSVTSTMSVSSQGGTSVTFHCMPPSTDKSARHLNSPPVDY